MITGPALSPGRGPSMLVASVGYGTVIVVPLPEVARAWASTIPLRVKLATDRPKPKLANPAPVITKLAGGEARSTGLGVMELTPGALTVSEVLPTRLQLFVDPV